MAYATGHATTGPTLTLRRSTVVGNTGTTSGIGAVDDWQDINRNGSVDVIIDIVGYFTVDASKSGFVAVTPNRLADTRPDSRVGTQFRFGDHTDTRSFVVVGGVIPTDAKAIVVNVTAVNPSAGSQLDGWPAGSAKPIGSNINYTAGQTVPNLVTVKIGLGGAINL